MAFGRISHVARLHGRLRILCKAWFSLDTCLLVRCYVRVHSSSCGAHRDVVHSPFEWLYHRCHCNCRGFVLSSADSLLRGCLRRDVVWWWFFLSWWCLRFYLGQCEADGWKIPLLLFPVLSVYWVYLHDEWLVQQLRRNLPSQLQLFPVQVEGQVSQRDVGVVSLRCPDHQRGP